MRKYQKEVITKFVKTVKFIQQQKVEPISRIIIQKDLIVNQPATVLKTCIYIYMHVSQSDRHKQSG